jgi:hypothetical protein
MKKCLLIAPLETHATIGRVAALALTGYELHVLDVSTAPLQFDLDRYPFSSIESCRRLDLIPRPASVPAAARHRLRALDWIAEDESTLASMESEICRVKPDLVVTYYGPIGIHYAKLVKCVAPSVPVVSILNLIPSSLDYPSGLAGPLGQRLNTELNTYKRWIRRIDFLVCASPLMTDFIAARYGVDRSRMAVIPDYFPKSMTVQSQAVSVREQPAGVIFLGAPERWGGALDDVDNEFWGIAKAGVPVCAGKLSDAVRSTGNARQYEYLQVDQVFAGGLSDFAHQFEAALITYGIKDRHQRFITTLPTRFFSALSAGLPLAVKAGLFDAVEDYVHRHQIGFAFCNPAELKRRLSDQAQMAFFRRNVLDHVRGFFAESQAGEFRGIFDSLTSLKKAG